MVYFISSDKKFTKIGSSENPQSRLRQLQQGNPFELEITHLFQGGWELEWEFQQMLDRFHHRAEWFLLPKSITTKTSQELLFDLNSFLAERGVGKHCTEFLTKHQTKIMRIRNEKRTD